jgi:uncharacterized membrane protein
MDSNSTTNYFQARHGRLIISIALLLISVGIRLPGLFSRSIWYDESITLLETAGHTLPAWPTEPTPARLAKAQFEGIATFKQIAYDLRSSDTYPPLYYWSVCLWKRWWGSSLNATRGFSLICSVATILALYGLLCVARFEYAFIPTLIYALSSSSVHFGQEARAYALATLWITSAALFAYLCTQVVLQESRWRFGAYSMGMGICCGAAFLTHYLTIFSTGVILAWFLAQVRPVLRPMVIGPLLLTASMAVVGLFTLSGQHYGHQPLQPFGLLSETYALVKMNLNLFWRPAFISRLGSPVRGLIFALVGASILWLVHQWPRVNRKLWLLVLALAIAPSVGIIILDLSTNWYLHETRYLVCAGPALAVVAANGVLRLISSRPPWGWSLLAVLLAIQFTGINWGKETGVFDPIRWRSLAKIIQASPSSSRAVIVGSGGGRPWYPAALIYELDPDVTVATLGNELDLDELAAQIEKYDHVWIVCSPEDGIMSTTRPLEERFLNRLQEPGVYKQIDSYSPCLGCRSAFSAILLQKFLD